MGIWLELWNVTPPAGILSSDDAVQPLVFSLDSMRLQARDAPHEFKFRLLSNSLQVADRNLTIVTNVFVSADPVASLSYATLGNTSGVAAGGTLPFHLTLVDIAKIEILDASNQAYSAILAHAASNTSVLCRVVYDTISARQEGGCDLPKLVCDANAQSGNSHLSGECELSPPVGEFVLEVSDREGLILGGRYYFTVQACPASYYRNDDGVCVLCKATTTCDAGSTIADWKLLEGYWRTDLASSKIHVCRFGRVSCPGDDLNQAEGGNPYCAPAFVGPLCSECDSDHFMSWTGDGRCHACEAGESHHPTIALVCSVVVLGAAVVAFVSQRCRNSTPRDHAETRTNTYAAKAERLFLLAKVKIFTLFLATQVQ